MAKSVTIYGIKNCDTMKKARAWLDEHGVAYAFHDYKTEGIERAKLESWVKEVGWETLLNRAGTTFRKLPDKDREGVTEKRADRADAGAAFDDQAAGAGSRRQADGRIQAGGLREGVREIDGLHGSLAKSSADRIIWLCMNWDIACGGPPA